MPLSGGNNSLTDVVQTTITNANSYQKDSLVTDFNNDHLDANGTMGDSQIANIPVSTEQVSSLITSNPVTLKTFCIQRLNAAITRTKPKTLMKYCIDFMSWNDQHMYPCCMQLPCSLNTNKHVAELQQIQTCPTKGASLNESILYNHLKINTIVKDLWMQQAITKKYSVPIKKLTETEIASWKPSSRANTWEDIDPYSGLEDVSSSSESEHPSEKVTESTSSTESDASNIRWRLCTRKPVRHITGRPTRKASCSINYKDLLHEDISQMTKKPKKHPTALSGPSESRITARGKHTKPPSRTHIIPVKRPVKVEMPEPIPDPQNSDPPTGTSNNTHPDADVVDSSDDNIPLNELCTKQETDTTTAEKTVKKRVFVTCRVGIIKHRRKQTCKCPICLKRYPSQEKLNQHNRQAHDKLKCQYCPMVFTTPSSLQRHQYVHSTPRFHCRCGKGFYFLAELKIHKLKHRRTRIAICSYPVCTKSYFSQSDLVKHACMHLKIKWNCNQCDYSMHDERLLKSHKRKHEQKIKYTCSRCGKDFVYHTQWARHTNKNTCKELKCSSSPEV